MDDLLNMNEVAALLGVHRARVIRARKTGRFAPPTYVPGLRRPRWRRDDVLRWAASLQTTDDPLSPVDTNLALAELRIRSEYEPEPPRAA